MKSVLFLLLAGLLILPAGVYAQEKDRVTVIMDDQDTFPDWDDDDFNIHIDFGKDRTSKNVHTRWFLLDLGFSAWEPEQTYTLGNGVDPFETRLWKSTNVNIHLVQQRLNIINHNLNFIYGVSFEFHKHFFDNNVILLDDAPQVAFEYVPDANWKKNRLSYTYLTVPLMLNFESNPRSTWRSFHLNAGVFGGPLLGANFKIKESGGSKDKTKDNFNLNQWRYGARAEIGFGPISLYGTYAFSDVFDEDKNGGFELTPYSFGFVIIPF